MNFIFLLFSCRTTFGLRAKDYPDKLRGHEILISNKQNGCAFMGGVLHQILHAFGFPHENAREDRKDFVEIHWKNIKEGMFSKSNILGL